MPGIVSVRRGYEFAVLALPHASPRHPPSHLAAVSDTLAVSSSLPESLLKSWRASIGSRHEQELRNTSLFLWATRPLEAGGPEDALRRELFRFYFGLLLELPYFRHGRMTLIMGARRDGEPQVSSILPYAQVWGAAGSPQTTMTLRKLKMAEQLGVALLRLEASPGRNRSERMFRTFREASEARYGDERLHQFVRSTEGIAFARGADEYTERMAELCAGRCRPYLAELYMMRGRVEHLRGPYHNMPRHLSAHGRKVRLFRAAYLAETVARFCLRQYVMDPALWPHFESDQAAAAFWRLSRAQRRRIWRTRLHVPRVLRDFDAAQVDRD